MTNQQITRLELAWGIAKAFLIGAGIAATVWAQSAQASLDLSDTAIAEESKWHAEVACNAEFWDTRKLDRAMVDLVYHARIKRAWDSYLLACKLRHVFIVRRPGARRPGK